MSARQETPPCPPRPIIKIFFNGSEAGEKNLVKHTSESGGAAVHYVVITAGPIPVSPAWGAHGNRVVMALFPQMVHQTLDRLAAKDVKERCILANPDFARGRKLLPESCSSVIYVDTRQGVSDLYTFALPAATAGAWRSDVGAAEQLGVDGDDDRHQDGPTACLARRHRQGLSFLALVDICAFAGNSAPSLSFARAEARRTCANSTITLAATLVHARNVGVARLTRRC